MRDDARFLRICLTPYSANTPTDIKWMLDKRAAGQWERILPELAERKETTKTLLLANYDTTPDSLRYNNVGKDLHTWANGGFQALLSCKGDDVVRYKRELAHPTMALTTLLRPKIRHDDDYLNEIIGTLYLREGKYGAAARYLEQVSLAYQTSMNIYKGGYLFYNPWDYYYTKDSSWWHPWWRGGQDDEGGYGYGGYYDAGDGQEWYEPQVVTSKVTRLPSQKNAKLNFAREMVRLEKEMRSGKTGDDRAMARLRFAIGRYNSLNTCWALTQYWIGASNQCYYRDQCFAGPGRRNFIISTPRELKGMDEWFEKEVKEAIGQMEGEETLAEAHLLLRNYRTIARHYPATRAGALLASECDSWSDWL